MSSVPKIIHQIWVGPNEIPPQCMIYMEGVRELHPEYKYILWTNDNLPELPEKVQTQMNRYGNNKKWAFQCDVLRYYLLNEFGGIYLDVDFEVKKNLTPLMTKPFNITLPPYRKNHVFWVYNGAFGTEPNNPVLIKIIQTLKDEIYHGPIFLETKLKNLLTYLPLKKLPLRIYLISAWSISIFIVCLLNCFFGNMLFIMR